MNMLKELQDEELSPKTFCEPRQLRLDVGSVLCINMVFTLCLEVVAVLYLDMVVPLFLDIQCLLYQDALVTVCLGVVSGSVVPRSGARFLVLHPGSTPWNVLFEGIYTTDALKPKCSSKILVNTEALRNRRIPWVSFVISYFLFVLMFTFILDDNYCRGLYGWPKCFSRQLYLVEKVWIWSRVIVHGSCWKVLIP